MNNLAVKEMFQQKSTLCFFSGCQMDFCCIRNIFFLNWCPFHLLHSHVYSNNIMFCLLCIQLLFDELLERLKEKEEKEAKKRQRLADDFSDLLYSIKVWPKPFKHSILLSCCILAQLVY